MRRRSSTRILHVLGVVMLLSACSSGDGGEDAVSPPSSATGSDVTGSTGAPSGPETAATEIDACSLITQEDAEIALGAEVEIVEDPFGGGLLEGDPDEFAGACAYRPSGSNDERMIAIGVAAPGSITPEEFEELTAGGVALGGPGDEGYAVNDGVLFRSGDLIVGIIVHTGEGMDTDRALALELAGIAAEGLPEPTPDPSNAACQLLTEALAEEILGIDLVFVSDVVVDDQRSGCGYREQAGPTIVSLRVTRGTDAERDYEGAFDLASDEEGFRELDVLGHRSFLRVNEGAVDVVVLADDTFLGLMTFSPDDDLTEETIELATEVASSI